MSLKNSVIVMKKDIDEFRKTKYIMFTLILMPLMFAIIVPVASIAPTLANVTEQSLEKVGIKPVPGVSPQQLIFEFMIKNMVFLFILIPLATPSMIGSYTIVGEKLNKSLEPLLATPITDSELLLGKILACIIPAIVSTIISFVVFTIITNVLALTRLGIFFLPGAEWFIAVFLLSPLLAFLSTVITVMLSSRMNDIRAVQQAAVVTVLPIMGLFILSMTGMNVTSMNSLFAIAAIVLVINLVLFKITRKLFQREEILTRWK